MLECVLGLGKSLFYNSAMEACVVICRSKKPKDRQGKTLFIQAVNDVDVERTQAFLRPQHQSRILSAYQSFADDPGFARVYSTEQIAAEGFNLGIQRYVTLPTDLHDEGNARNLEETWSEFESRGAAFWDDMATLEKALDVASLGESE